MMAAMRAVAMPTAPLKASTAAISATVTAAIPAIGAPIGASASTAESTAITAAVASAALGALETRTRISAYAGEIFARSARIPRRAGFPRQKDSVLFNSGFDDGAVRRGCNRHVFRSNVLYGFVVSEVSALGFGQFRAIFPGVIFLTRFSMMFGVAGFGGKLFFTGFRFRLFAFFLFVLLFF
jgi:hypothetical protein